MSQKPAKPKTSPKAKPKAGTSKESAQVRRQAFAVAFVLNGENATEAAIAAGYTKRSAGQTAHRLMKDAETQRCIAIERDRLAQKADLSMEDLARALRQSLLFDPRKLFDAQGRLKPITELDDDTAANLTSIEVDSEETYTGTGKRRKVTGRISTAKVKWETKQGARDQLARMLGAYEKDNRQRSDPLAQLVAALQTQRSAFPIVEDPAA